MHLVKQKNRNFIKNISPNGQGATPCSLDFLILLRRKNHLHLSPTLWETVHAIIVFYRIYPVQGAINNFFSVYLLILRERERDGTSKGGAERERGGERILSRLLTVSPEPDMGLDFMICEIMT